MKKILLFLLLLVNLQLTTDSGSLGIGLGEVAAQNMNNELSEIVVTGSADVYCNQCWSRINRNDISFHKQYTCTKRIVKCSYCPQKFEAWQEAEHICRYHSSTSTSTSGSRCAKCGKPDSQCTCPSHCPLCNRPIGNCWCNVTVTGKGGNIGYSVTGGSGVSGGYSGSSGTEYAGGLGNTGQSTSNSKEPTYKRVPMIDLFDLAKTGKVKLLANLPSKLHFQTLDGECVVRALAFIMDYLKVKGQSVPYDTIYNKLIEIAKKPNSGCYIYDKKRGVPIVPPDKVGEIFGSYCNVNYYGNSQEKIIEFIDHNIPVATAKICPDGTRHMVTVIGYDADFFYVASGKTEDNANKVPRDELKGFMLFTVE